VDFSLEAFDRDKFAEYEKIANDLIARKSQVNFYFVSAKKPKKNSLG
jgi:misacylated tRNA(Ala) deacylase